MVENMSNLIREAVMLALDKGEAMVGAVAPLRDSMPQNGAADRRRRASPTAFVDAGLVVAPGEEPGSVWLRVEMELLPEVELEVVALLPVHMGNVTGQARVVAPKGIALSLTHTSPAPSMTSDSKSAAGVIVGAAMACLVCIVIVVLLARRRRAQAGQDGGPTVPPHFEQPRVMSNPLYQVADDDDVRFYDDVSSVNDYNHLEREGGYEQLRDGVANGDGITPGYNRMQGHAGEDPLQAGASHMGDRDGMMTLIHACDTSGMYQHEGAHTPLSGTAGGEVRRVGSGEAPPRRSNPDGSNDDNTMDGRQYVDVSRGPAQPIPGYNDDVEDEGLYQELGELRETVNAYRDEYLAIGSDYGGLGVSPGDYFDVSSAGLAPRSAPTTSVARS
jgi:hypothetical protein